MKIVINNYIRIPVDDLTPNQVKKIRRAATIKNPEVQDARTFGEWIDPNTPEYLLSYTEDDEYMSIKRGLWDTLIPILRLSDSDQVVWDTSLFENVGFRWKKQMEERKSQTVAVRRMLHHNQGILVAPTGSGKTNIMIRIIHELKQPTLILVHRNFLARQWRERIKEYLGYECGSITSDRIKIRNITIAMIPTLYRMSPRKLERIGARFGVVIADECHRVPAHTWQSIMGYFTAHYRFGCSATPTRKDKLQAILYHTIGPVRHIISSQSVVRTRDVLPVKVHVVRTDFQGKLANTRTRYQSMIPGLVSDKDRNGLIIAKILENHDQPQLVLSDRIIHLQVLANLLKKADPDLPWAIVDGSVPEEKRTSIFTQIKEGSIMVMFASSVADEGLDIPQLSRLHLAFPSRNTMRNRQQIGRVRRPWPRKSDPIVFDYYDWKNPTLKRQFQERRSFYRSEGFTVFIPDVTNNKGFLRGVTKI